MHVCITTVFVYTYFFDGSKHLQKRIPLSKQVTKSITTKFLGKLINVSLSVTKRTANNTQMGSQSYCQLLILCPSMESRNFGSIKTTLFNCHISILVLMQLHLLLHQRWNFKVTCYLTKWLHFPKSATCVILYLSTDLLSKCV